MHFNDSFSYKGSTEESPERHQEMSAGYTSQIKQWIRNL